MTSSHDHGPTVVLWAYANAQRLLTDHRELYNMQTPFYMDVCKAFELNLNSPVDISASSRISLKVEEFLEAARSLVIEIRISIALADNEEAYDPDVDRGGE